EHDRVGNVVDVAARIPRRTAGGRRYRVEDVGERGSRKIGRIDDVIGVEVDGYFPTGGTVTNVDHGRALPTGREAVRRQGAGGAATPNLIRPGPCAPSRARSGSARSSIVVRKVALAGRAPLRTPLQALPPRR